MTEIILIALIIILLTMARAKGREAAMQMVRDIENRNRR